MKKFLTALLAFMFIWTGFAFAEYDPVVVQVNNLGYTRSQVREALELARKSYEDQGSVLTEYEEEKMRRDVLEYFVRQGILENKAAELGLDTPTAEELEELEKEVQAQWELAQEKARQELITKYGLTEEKAVEYTPMFLDLTGITLEELRLELGALLKQNKLIEFITQDVPRVTEEEARAWYVQNLVSPDEITYRDNIEAFETNVILNGAECYYIPGEYRYIRNIVFLAPDEDREAIKLKMLELGDAEEALVVANNALYGCQVLEEDPTQALADQEAAQARIDSLTKEIEEMKLALAEPFADAIADIMTRLEAGEDFSVLQAQYDQNPEPFEDGYLVCAESVIWEKAFTEGAMALENPGDFSDPVYLAAGPQILLYAREAPRGALPLDEESLQAVIRLAQTDADNKLLLGYVAQWKKEYQIATHEELLLVQD